MADNETRGQTEYLDRAKQLRATAAQVRDQSVIDERMAAAAAVACLETALTPRQPY